MQRPAFVDAHVHFFDLQEPSLDYLSGLGMVDPQWSVASIRPWVSTCIEEFGIERSLFGTSWPVDRLYSSYTDVVAAYREIVSEFTEAPQHALLAGNARRIFRLAETPSVPRSQS